MCFLKGVCILLCPLLSTRICLVQADISASPATEKMQNKMHKYTRKFWEAVNKAHKAKDDEAGQKQYAVEYGDRKRFLYDQKHAAKEQRMAVRLAKAIRLAKEEAIRLAKEESEAKAHPDSDDVQAISSKSIVKEESMAKTIPESDVTEASSSKSLVNEDSVVETNPESGAAQATSSKSLVKEPQQSAAKTDPESDTDQATLSKSHLKEPQQSEAKTNPESDVIQATSRKSLVNEGSQSNTIQNSKATSSTPETSKQATEDAQYSLFWVAIFALILVGMALNIFSRMTKMPWHTALKESLLAPSQKQTINPLPPA